MRKKSYIKASRRQDGYFEMPFEELTDELIYKYSECSKREIEKINLILEEAPELLSADGQPMLGEINTFLEQLDISTDLSKLYNYKGGVFTLRFYLDVRGGVDKDSAMLAVGAALSVLLTKAVNIFHNDIDELIQTVDMSYFAGRALSLALYEAEIVAGGSRTGEASKAKSELSVKREKEAIAKATELKRLYPRMTKDGMSEVIAEDLGLSKWTVLDYLKGVDLSS